MSAAAEGAPTLSVSADLRLVIDGTRATVRADGHEVTVRTDDPGRLIAAALGSVRAMPNGGSSTGDLTRAVASQSSRLLHDSGLSARFVGPHGTVLEMGRGSESRTARLLLRGSPIALGSPSALIWTAAEYTRAVVSRRPARYASAAISAAIIAVLLGTAPTRRSRRKSNITASTSIPASRNG